MSQLFKLGTVVATPAALEAFKQTCQSPLLFVDRHARGDWGELSPGDTKANQDALTDGSRIMSVYKLFDGSPIWIITNAVGDDGKRDATTLLTPDDY